MKQGKGDGECQASGCLLKVVREGLFGKAKPEQRPEGNEEAGREPPAMGKEEHSSQWEQRVQRPRGRKAECWA